MLFDCVFSYLGLVFDFLEQFHIGSEPRYLLSSGQLLHDEEKEKKNVRRLDCGHTT